MLPSLLVTGTVLPAKMISSGCMNERAKTSRYAAVHMCCHARRRSQTCSSFFLWNVHFFFCKLTHDFYSYFGLPEPADHVWMGYRTDVPQRPNQPGEHHRPVSTAPHSKNPSPTTFLTIFWFFWRFVFLSKKRNYSTHQPTFLTQSHFLLISCTRAVH